MPSLRAAFKLSKEEVRSAKPPGTSTLIEHLEWTASQTTHDEIRLVPQPSADPADPLNLPFWRKLAMLFTMSLHPFVVNITSASLASVLPIYASTPIFGLPPKPFSKISYFLAVNLVLLGVGNLIWVPLANTFGRRPVILTSLIMLVLTSMWAGLATTYNGLLAARALMGFAGAPADAVSPEVVGEIFFVHQKGRAMAVYTIFLSLGSLVGGLFGGYLAAAKGLHWLHWMNVILSAITFVLCLVFQAETLYERKQLSSDSQEQRIDTKEAVVLSDSSTPSSYPSYSYLRSLRLITYRPGFARQFIAPYKVLRLPGVWLVSGWYAGLVGLIVTCSTIGPQLLASPPYLWGKDVGLLNVGGIIGALLGAIYTYLVADFTTKRLAKKDAHGFSEPESRLGIALPALFIATAGSLVFGFVAQHPAPTRWLGLQFGYGMIAFGLMQAPSVGFNYLIEAYGALAGDCFVAVTSARAVVSFAWSFFVADWVQRDGAAEPFGVFAALMGVCGLATVPVMVWGKRLRIWTAKWVRDRYVAL